MNVDLRGRSARYRRLAPAALVLMAGAWGAGAARADIHVHVMNCTDDSVHAWAYDAEDSVKALPASSTEFHFGEPGASAELHCAGEGKGYCEMTIGNSDLATSCTGGEDIGSVGFHLDSGKWAVITGFKSENNKCTPIVEQNLDAGSCS
ncbi:MAG TPA: hypothetical protein VFS60_08615 [Thermoanaerobaculia bacterium]|nr:hypothetical protein [Thermoanaerobaculia bacterium]